MFDVETAYVVGVSGEEPFTRGGSAYDGHYWVYTKWSSPAWGTQAYRFHDPRAASRLVADLLCFDTARHASYYAMLNYDAAAAERRCMGGVWCHTRPGDLWAQVVIVPRASFVVTGAYDDLRSGLRENADRGVYRTPPLGGWSMLFEIAGLDRAFKC